MIKSAEIQRPYPLGHGGRLSLFCSTLNFVKAEWCILHLACGLVGCEELVYVCMYVCMYVLRVLCLFVTFEP